MSARRRPFQEQALVYLPLALHLFPTLAIGYLIVIPQSCIAGMNEMTLGFAAANLGFILSYAGGVRLARGRRQRDA